MQTITVVNPAVAFGLWLKERRRSKSIVARVFAERISLTHAQYAEAELGVFKWIQDKQLNLIPIVLDLDAQARRELNDKASAAKMGVALTFSDIFSRDDLRPVRAFHLQGKQISKADEERILDTVFTPLA